MRKRAEKIPFKEHSAAEFGCYDISQLNFGALIGLADIERAIRLVQEDFADTGHVVFVGNAERIGLIIGFVMWLAR